MLDDDALGAPATEAELDQLQADGEFDDFENTDAQGADCEGKWYHEAWIPLVMDYGGNNYCLDMRSGRLVSMGHEVGSEFLDYADWPVYLEAAADSLEATGLPFPESSAAPGVAFVSGACVGRVSGRCAAFVPVARWACAGGEIPPYSR